MKLKKVIVEGFDGACLVTEDGHILTLEEVEELVVEARQFYNHLQTKGVEMLISTSDGKLLAFRESEINTEKHPLTNEEAVTFMMAESRGKSLEEAYNWDDDDKV